ncbi:glutaminase A [Mycobacterium sp.]|uniref:glutaminase A n=1 Tax=Mycobacterium sp. TaxID=1785 RepID=UPI003A89C8E2
MAIAPLDPAAIDAAVTRAHSLHRNNARGRNASYIPALAGADPDLFAVCAMTPDGHASTAGDVEHEFAIESVSKVFTLALVLEERGQRAVRATLGANATGGAFDSVLALERHHDKPTSPMVNAGAIAATGLVRAADAAERWRKIMDIQSAFAGRPLSMSAEINASEQATNGHNKAIAWLMHSAGTLSCDPMEACAVYTRQCSTMLTTVDLAVMGATLAAGGVNPRTGLRVMTHSNVSCLLAEMVTEGMYTQSGDWAYTVGVPAKSGVAGAVLAVVPGRLAVAAFSPRLNKAGNSVRGWYGVAEVVKRLKLSLFDNYDQR